MSSILMSLLYKYLYTENTLPILTYNNTPSTTTLYILSHTLPNVLLYSNN